MGEKDAVLTEWKRKMNGIEFMGCEDVAVGDALHYVLLDSKQLDWKSGIRAVVRIIIRNACQVSYEIEKKGNPNSIFLFSNSSRGREDHLKAFNNVTAFANDYVKVTCSKYKFSLWGIKYLAYPFRWSHDLKSAIPQFGLRMHLLSYMFQAFMDYQYVVMQCEKHGWKIKNLMTYCDVMPVDSFFVQKFNAAGKKTVTLQHGTYITKINAWAYLGSKSAHFLADSPYSVQCARDAGYRGNIIPVGSPHHLALGECKKPDIFKTEKIGIFLNSDDQPKEVNVHMIQCVQKYCRTTHRKVLLKFHPNNDRDFYGQYIDKAMTKTYAMEVSASDFGGMVDVAVVSASTVFTTMLRQWTPVLLYEKKGYDLGMFTDVDGLKFSSEGELEEKIRWISSPGYAGQLGRYREYFLSAGDIAENYKMAFREIGIM